MDVKAILDTQRLKQRIEKVITGHFYSTRQLHVVIEIFVDPNFRSEADSDFWTRIRERDESRHSDLTIRLIDHGIDINFSRSGQLYSITNCNNLQPLPDVIDWSRLLMDPAPVIAKPAPRRRPISIVTPDTSDVIFNTVEHIIIRAYFLHGDDESLDVLELVD